LNQSTANFSLHAYEDTINGDIHLALVKNKIKSTDEVLVRVQQNNTLQDIMGINKFGSRLSFFSGNEKD
jgi:GTP cyclohydrolase II